MICKKNLKIKLKQQLDFFNYLNIDIEFDDNVFDEAINRMKLCLKHIKNKYIDNDFISSEVGFNPYNSTQYAIFLYYLANSYFNHFGNNNISESLYLLNKQLHSIELFYNRRLPEYWYMEHPIGSVIGNANYSNGIIILQGVTIGANKGIIRPTFSGHTMLFANATLIGDCKIGKNVIISANTYIKETDIPDNSMVFGCSPNLIIKEKSEEYMKKFFSDFFVS